MDCKDMKNTLDEQLNEILKQVQIQLTILDAKKRILSDEAQQVGAKHNNLYSIKGGKK